MLECIYEKDNIDLIYDTDEDTFYLNVTTKYVLSSACTQDYTKEELITILKDVIKILNV